jgi:hypothetical protein
MSPAEIAAKHREILARIERELQDAERERRKGAIAVIIRLDYGCPVTPVTIEAKRDYPV